MIPTTIRYILDRWFIVTPSNGQTFGHGYDTYKEAEAHRNYLIKGNAWR